MSKQYVDNIQGLVLEPQKAEEDIQKTLKKIVNILLEEEMTQKVIMYLLGGGFGRGEGSVRYNGTQYETTNDYDLFAICDEDIKMEAVTSAVSKIERLLNLKFFGIEIIRKNEWIEICKSKVICQSYYDLIFGHKILWRDNEKSQDIIYLLEQANTCSYHVKIDSAFDVLRTRFWCVNALVDYSGQEATCDKKYCISEEFFCFQQIKALTAITDAVLIAENRYKTPCFGSKVKELEQTQFAQTDDVSLAVDLITRKIRNQTESINMDQETYLTICNLYYRTFQYIRKLRKKEYYCYLLKEKLFQIYYHLFKHKRYTVYSIRKIKLLKKRKKTKLSSLQTQMRGVYK